MEHFSNKDFKRFLSWLEQLDKIEICKEFLDEDNDIKNILLVFNINGVQDDYYDIPLHTFDNIKENIVNELQNNEYIDDDLNIILSDTVDYPDDALYFFDIYIENRENGFKMLYGTYYPSGFDTKYEIINEGY